MRAAMKRGGATLVLYGRTIMWGQKHLSLLMYIQNELLYLLLLSYYSISRRFTSDSSFLKAFKSVKCSII